MRQNRHRVLCLATLFLAALPQVATAQAAPPKQVGVVTAEITSVPRIVTLPGRAVAGANAAIRPRVGGIITGILYDAGAPIKQGAPMFRIDDTTYAANLSSAEANVASAEAAVTEAESTYARAERLQGSGTTLAQVESARATLGKARAGLRAAQAAQNVAEAELGWTTITSPIDGMASVAEISVGDLVTAGQPNALATVTRLDPIDVDMYEPSARMLAILGEVASGQLQTRDRLRARLTLETGQTYNATGELVAPGFSVSTSTGAIDTRFRFENPKNLILPGMFLRGQVDLGTTQAILVSQSAASRDKTGKLKAWIISDGKAQQRVLTEHGTYRHNWIVTDGITDGELLAVDGLAGLTEGVEVVTVAVTFDENGVLHEIAEDQAQPDAKGEAVGKEADNQADKAAE